MSAGTCNCDQAKQLAAELAAIKAERDYLLAFADLKEVAAMRRELAAEWDAIEEAAQ